MITFMIIHIMWQLFRSGKEKKKKDFEILYCNLLQSVKSNGHILQSTRLPDEEKDGVASRHAPQFLVHLWAVAEEVVHTTFGDDLESKVSKNKHVKTGLSFDSIFPILPTLALTYPGWKVQFGLKVRHRLRVLPGQWQVTEVSLHGVTSQLEVHLLLLTTLGAQHPFPQVRVVEMPCLPFAGTMKRGRGSDTQTCQRNRRRRRKTQMDASLSACEEDKHTAYQNSLPFST